MLSFRSKLNLAIAVLVLMITGCQPEGGELVPVGGENIEISTSRFDNDTAIVNDGYLKIKLYGSWNTRAKVRVIVENNNPYPVTMDFNQSTVLDSKGGNLIIDSVSEESNNGVKQIEDKQYQIGAKEKRKFLIGFPLNLASSLEADPPRIISVVLAVESDPRNKELHRYKFDFRGIEKIETSEKADPIF